MLLSTLEITENEYLIRLSREEFQIGFISQLLREIKHAQSKSSNSPEQPTGVLDGRIPDRECMLQFDDLRDK